MKTFILAMGMVLLVMVLGVGYTLFFPQEVSFPEISKLLDGIPSSGETPAIPREKVSIQMFFSNTTKDPSGLFCEKTYPTERIIEASDPVFLSALEELLKGPAPDEEAQGFFTSINPNVKIQSFDLRNGIAKVDFDEQLEFQVGGSCRVAAIRSQITETLKQFPQITNVIISIDGRTEDILQP